VPSFAVILPAAGQSSRFGAGEKKPFLALDGKAIWLRSAELFWNRPEVQRVCVVVSPDDLESFKLRFGAICSVMDVKIVTGGAERFASVANALSFVPDDVEFVAVHDAVRPLITPKLIDEVFAASAERGAAMLAVPVADTLKRVEAESNRIAETVPRAGLWAAQTPQVFRRDWLVEAYARRGEIGTPITDDAQLVEALGHSVFVVPGSRSNFKITTRDDFELAEAILKARQPKATPPSLAPFDEDAKW
jgi:2-C-methyl-D-erythritol 4-phosphate cytidylyltransferase